jgi:hypothetical protein
MTMKYVWTIEQVEEIVGSSEEITREDLSKIFNCHVNTIYNYEKILRENLNFLKDARKYYEDEDGRPKKWVELNKYLCWLLCKVKTLHGKIKVKNKRKKIRKHFFSYSEYYTEERCDYEIEQQLEQQRSEKSVEQPEQSGGCSKQAGSSVAA